LPQRQWQKKSFKTLKIGSPQSHSDWSEGILSPPASGMNQFQQQQQHLAQHQMLQQQQQQQKTDSVLI